MFSLKTIAWTLTVVWGYTVSSSLANYTDLSYVNYDTKTLRLVSVLFRHGARTPEYGLPGQSYPNDPYVNETYFPYGGGQLKNEGKVEIYLVGKSLRDRYNKFLGRDYLPGVLEARSTAYDRTKASLELALAGLYPPKNTLLEWKKDLNWNPIPQDYSELKDDKILTLSVTYCDRYKKLFDEYMASKEGIKIRAKYLQFFKLLTKHTGVKINTLFESLRLCDFLKTQKEFGLQLPLWVTSDVLKTCTQCTNDYWTVGSATSDLKKLAGGFLLRKILDDARLKMAGELVPDNRKIFLYSAHDISVVYLLNAMNIYFWHGPPYGAYVLVEFHQINGVFGVKVFYQYYVEKYPSPFKIPGCDYFCPLHRFEKLLHDNIPVGDHACDIKEDTANEQV